MGTQAEEQYERDLQLPHIDVGDVSFFVEEDNRFYNARLEMFGRSYLVNSVDDSGKPNWRTRSINLDGYEIDYYVKSFNPLVVSIRDHLFAVTSEQLELISKHLAEINASFVNDRKRFQQEVTELVESLTLKSDIVEMARNFIESLGPDFFMDFKIIAGIEYKLNGLSRRGERLLLSERLLREKLVNQTTQEANHVSTTHVRLTNESEVSDFMDNHFNMFVKVLDRRVGFDDPVYATFTTYELLKQRAVHHFADKWAASYGEYFINNAALSLSQACEIYVSLDTVVPKRLVDAGTFIYYLMKQCKFSQDNNVNYLNAYDEFLEHLEIALGNKQLNEYEHKLLVSRRVKTYTVDDVDLMNGRDFENLVGVLFSKLGYSTTVTRGSHDQGIDVVAVKNGQRIGIQTKCYSKPVTNKAIQEVVAGIIYYNVDKTLVVTNNYFTDSAMELAAANSVVLWDRDMLAQKLREVFSANNN